MDMAWKTLILVLWLIILNRYDLSAQTNNLPQHKYKNKLTLTDIMRSQKSVNGFMVSYGYHQTTFLNPVFGNNINDDIIKKKYGGVFTASYTAYPFIFDIDWFSSRFRVQDKVSWPYNDTTNVRHRGMSFFISSALFPLVHSKSFLPYIGIGYQSSALGVGIEIVKVSKGGKSVEQSSINTSCPQWKIGFKLKWWEAYWLIVEYRQSIMLNQEKSLNELSVLIGLNTSH